MKTVKQCIEELPERIKTVHLHTTRGVFLETCSVGEAIEKYGNWMYHSGYSDGFTVVSLWIFR